MLTKMIETLALHSIAIYPTGSRYFGDNHAYSDWDYYTKNSEKTREILRGLGFITLLKDHGSKIEYDYYDKLIVSVMRYKHDGLDIDVQLVNDIQTKHAAHTLMKFNITHYLKTNKIQRYNLWNNAYKIVEQLRLTVKVI